DVIFEVGTPVVVDVENRATSPLNLAVAMLIQKRRELGDLARYERRQPIDLSRIGITHRRRRLAACKRLRDVTEVERRTEPLLLVMDRIAPTLGPLASDRVLDAHDYRLHAPVERVFLTGRIAHEEELGRLVLQLDLILIIVAAAAVRNVAWKQPAGGVR